MATYAVVPVVDFLAAARCRQCLSSGHVLHALLVLSHVQKVSILVPDMEWAWPASDEVGCHRWNSVVGPCCLNSIDSVATALVPETSLVEAISACIDNRLYWSW
jgi:hypothetical protein